MFFGGANLLAFIFTKKEKKTIAKTFFKVNQNHICFDAIARILFLLCSVVPVPCALKTPVSLRHSWWSQVLHEWKRPSNNTNYLKPHFFSSCFMMPRFCKQRTQRIIYFLVQVVPSYIHLISARQKNLITGDIRHEKRSLLYVPCGPADGTEISGKCS